MSDQDYYEQRLEQERASAASAQKSEVIAAHQGLADLYAARLNGTGQLGDAPPTGPHLRLIR